MDGVVFTFVPEMRDMQSMRLIDSERILSHDKNNFTNYRYGVLMRQKVRICETKPTWPGSFISLKSVVVV